MGNYSEKEHESERYRCPFYGISIIEKCNAMIESHSNRCALITDSHHPCKMETSGQSPDWDGCEFNNSDNFSLLEKLADFIVFPKDSKSGISFQDWTERVIG